MKAKRIYFAAAIALILAIAISIPFLSPSAGESFGQRREKVLNELSLSIKEAKLEGKYKCCIEPACTMCYMGNWLWDDGTCDCDGMIAAREFDKVCPQCIRGIEEGRCQSSEHQACNPAKVLK